MWNDFFFLIRHKEGLDISWTMTSPKGSENKSRAPASPYETLYMYITCCWAVGGPRMHRWHWASRDSWWIWSVLLAQPKALHLTSTITLQLPSHSILLTAQSLTLMSTPALLISTSKRPYLVARPPLLLPRCSPCCPRPAERTQDVARLLPTAWPPAGPSQHCVLIKNRQF